MITLKDFFECTDYRISESSEYLWNCFGKNVLILSYEDEGNFTVCVYYNNKSQRIFEMQAWDYKNNREYRWIDSEFENKQKDESVSRGIDFYQSIDDRKFIDLELSEDILEKAKSIIKGEEYDTRVLVPLNLEKDLMLQLMTLAHEADMTLNKFVEYILVHEIRKLK